MEKKYRILGEFIKNISAKTKDVESYIYTKENISKFKLFIDISTKPLKNKMAEVSIKTKFRDELINFLKEKKISTAVHFVPLPMNKLYKQFNNKSLKNTKDIWKEIVSLPFFPNLENKKINYIINCLKKFDESKRI